MSKPKRSERKELVSAQVFLRSVSGRSIRECANGPLPTDLSPFQAPEKTRVQVVRLLQELGFKVRRDSMDLTLSIEASPAIFAKVFGVSAAQATGITPDQTISLQPPTEIKELVEEIILAPKPEYF